MVLVHYCSTTVGCTSSSGRRSGAGEESASVSVSVSVTTTLLEVVLVSLLQLQ